MVKRARTKSAASKRVARAVKRYRPMGFPNRTIPDTLRVLMRYKQTVFLNSGAIAESKNTFRALSINDPDYSGVGGQPYGHDSYSSLYGKYRVRRVKIEAWFENVDNVYPAEINVCAHESLTSPPATFQVAVENPASVSSVLGAEGNGGVTGKKLSLGWFTPEGFKGDPGARYDQDYQATFGSSPIKDFGLTIGARNMAGALSHSVRVMVVLSYDVELYDRVQQVAS